MHLHFIIYFEAQKMLYGKLGSAEGPRALHGSFRYFCGPYK